MKRDYRLFIKDMLESMEAIERFVEGMEFEEFSRTTRQRVR